MASCLNHFFFGGVTNKSWKTGESGPHQCRKDTVPSCTEIKTKCIFLPCCVSSNFVTSMPYQSITLPCWDTLIGVVIFSFAVQINSKRIYEKHATLSIASFGWNSNLPSTCMAVNKLYCLGFSFFICKIEDKNTYIIEIVSVKAR